MTLQRECLHYQFHSLVQSVSLVDLVLQQLKEEVVVDLHSQLYYLCSLQPLNAVFSA